MRFVYKGRFLLEKKTYAMGWALRTPIPWFFEDGTKKKAHSAAGFSPSLTPYMFPHFL